MEGNADVILDRDEARISVDSQQKTDARARSKSVAVSGKGEYGTSNLELIKSMLERPGDFSAEQFCKQFATCYSESQRTMPKLGLAVAAVAKRLLAVICANIKVDNNVDADIRRVQKRFIAHITSKMLIDRLLYSFALICDRFSKCYKLCCTANAGSSNAILADTIISEIGNVSGRPHTLITPFISALDRDEHSKEFAQHFCSAANQTKHRSNFRRAFPGLLRSLSEGTYNQLNAQDFVGACCIAWNSRRERNNKQNISSRNANAATYYNEERLIIGIFVELVNVALETQRNTLLRSLSSESNNARTAAAVANVNKFTDFMRFMHESMVKILFSKQVGSVYTTQFQLQHFASVLGLGSLADVAEQVYSAVADTQMADQIAEAVGEGNWDVPADYEVLVESAQNAAVDASANEIDLDVDADDLAQWERLSPPRTTSRGERHSISPKKAKVEWTIGKDGKLEEKPRLSTEFVVNGESSSLGETTKKEYLLRFRNVADDVQASEFKDFVSQHVQAVNCRLLKDKKGQINALVSVPDREAIERAIKRMDGIKYKGRVLGVAEYAAKTDAKSEDRNNKSTDAVRRTSPDRDRGRRSSNHRTSSSSPSKRSLKSSDQHKPSSSRRLSIKQPPPLTTSSSSRNADRRRSRSRSPPSKRQRNSQTSRGIVRSSRERGSSPRANGILSSSRRRAISPPRRSDSGRGKVDSRPSDNRRGRMSRSRSPPSSARHVNDGRFDRDRLGVRRDFNGWWSRIFSAGRGADLSRQNAIAFHAIDSDDSRPPDDFDDSSHRRYAASPPASLRTADLASRQQQQLHRVGPPAGIGSNHSARSEFSADGRRIPSRKTSPGPTVQSRIGPPSGMDTMRAPPARGPPLPAAVHARHAAHRSPSPHSRRTDTGSSSHNRDAVITEDLRRQLRARRERELQSEEERARDERLALKRDAEEELARTHAELRRKQKEIEEKEAVIQNLEMLAHQRATLEREQRRHIEAEERIKQLREELARPLPIASMQSVTRPVFTIPGGGMTTQPQFSQQQLLMQLEQQRNAAGPYGARLHAAAQQQQQAALMQQRQADAYIGRTIPSQPQNNNEHKEVRLVERDLGRVQRQPQQQQQQDPYGRRAAAPMRGGGDAVRQRDEVDGKYLNSNSGRGTAVKREYESMQTPAQREYMYTSGSQQLKTRRENSPSSAVPRLAASSQSSVDMLRALHQQQQLQQQQQRSNYGDSLSGYAPVSQQSMKQPMNLGSSTTRSGAAAAAAVRQDNADRESQFRQSSGATRAAASQYNLMPQQQLSSSSYANTVPYAGGGGQQQTSNRGDPSAYQPALRNPSSSNAAAYQQALAMQQQQQLSQYNQARLGNANTSAPNGSSGRSAAYNNGQGSAGVVDARQHLQQQQAQYGNTQQTTASRTAATGARGGAVPYNNGNPAAGYASAGFAQPQQQQTTERYWRQ